MTDYVVHLDRQRDQTATACLSASGACEKIAEGRDDGWALISILRNGFPIKEQALRTDADHEPRQR